jgi:hypothetical protein
LLLFLEKEESTRSIASLGMFWLIFWGLAPRPPGSASPNYRLAKTFREAEQRFLLLFLEKEEYSVRSIAPLSVLWLL